MSNKPTTQGFKRCPACGSRVILADAICEICGHEFEKAQGSKKKPTAAQIAQPAAAPKPPVPAPAEKPSPKTEPPENPPTTDTETLSPPPELPKSYATRKVIDPATQAQNKTAPATTGAKKTTALNAAAKKIKPATESLKRNVGKARFPVGLIGIGAVLALLLGGAVALMQRNTANTNSDAPAAIQLSVEAPTSAANPNAPPPTDTAANIAPTDAPAPPTPTPILVTPTPVPPQDYIVQSGDTCGGIAEKNGVGLSTLLAANNLSEGDCTRIRVGEKLQIPAPTPTPGATPTPQPIGAQSGAANNPNAEPTSTLPPELTYVVKPGDSCLKIAGQFNVSVQQIIQQNGLNANCTIKIGDRLVLKFAQPPPAATSLPQVAATPTARVGYPAPQLSSPQDGTTFSETQTSIILQWISVGLLKENEYYVVRIQPEGQTIVPIFETKSTSLRLTQDLVGNATEQRFAWFVSVKQKLATDPKNNQPIYNDVSSSSAARSFSWRKPQATATPAV